MKKLAGISALVLSVALARATPPNVVIIFCDDMGYADTSVYDSKLALTPHIDRLAKDGMKLTSFYVAQAVCSASRTALLTGCLPNRIGILGALGPHSNRGISDGETTIAQLLKSRGYACGIFGKWHLGDSNQFLPLQHGFDEFFGLPYSHDMWPVNYDGAPAKTGSPKAGYPPLFLIEGNEKTDPLNTLDDIATLTTRYTEHAVKFVEKNKDHPFFLYVPESLPHVPLAVSAKFKGKSGHGLYADVIEEIDWSVGEILAALDRTGVASNTLVVFTSDNGPWLRFGNHAGSAGPLREGKGTMFDGGCREPCLMRWPGHIKAGRVCNEIVASVDMLPTLAAITGADLPKHPMDGINELPLLENEGAKPPRDFNIYYYGAELQAFREGKWKLFFPHTCSQYIEGTAPGHDGFPGPAPAKKLGAALYDLEADINERHDVQTEHPEIVARLTKRCKDYDAELQANKREPGKIATQTTQIISASRREVD
jgi:arylsulfatase